MQSFRSRDLLKDTLISFHGFRITSVALEVDGFEFLDGVFAGEDRGVFSDRFGVAEGGEGLHSDVSSDVGEEGRRDAPGDPAFLNGLLLALLDSLSVDDFVVAAVDVAASDPLELLAGLQQQVSFGHRHRELLSRAEPRKEARVAGLAVDSEEVEVVVEAGEDSAYFVAGEVAAGGRQFVGSPAHHRGEGLPVEAHAHSCHFCNGVAAIDHVSAPTLHDLLELREVLGEAVLGDVLHDFANVVEVAPLAIVGGRRGGGWSVTLGVASDDLGKVAGFFCELGGSSDLEVLLGEDVGDGSPCIEVQGSAVEELLHHVDEAVVLGDVYPWVLDDETPVGVEGLRDGLAVLRVVAGLGQEGLHINDGHRQPRTEPSHDPRCSDHQQQLFNCSLTLTPSGFHPSGQSEAEGVG